MTPAERLAAVITEAAERLSARVDRIERRQEWLRRHTRPTTRHDLLEEERRKQPRRPEPRE